MRSTREGIEDSQKPACVDELTEVIRTLSVHQVASLCVRGQAASSLAT